MDSPRGSRPPAFGRLRVEELEGREAPAILLVNPAGNEPQGGGANNGQAIQAVNPAGHAPPGHNK